MKTATFSINLNGAPRLAGRGLRRFSENAALFLAPSLLLIGAVLVVPLFYAAWLSFHAVQANLFSPAPFIGLANYWAVLKSPDFLASSSRTLYFVVTSLLIQLPVGLAIALLLNEPFAGRKILRAIILIPWALPTIVNGALWTWIYQTNYGALNGILLQLGLIHDPILWLGSPWLAMSMVILADTWKTLPFYAVLFLAGLQTIPGDLYEAASVDGANAWQKLMRVTLPSLRSVLLVILVLRTMDTFRVFDIIYQITQGGPAGGTTVLAYQAYLSGFLQLQFGYSSAISFLIALAVFALAAFYLKVLPRREN